MKTEMLEKWETRLENAVSMLTATQSIDINEITVESLPHVLKLASSMIESVREEITLELIKTETGDCVISAEMV